jgi:SAM-dependent methyltransferase
MTSSRKVFQDHFSGHAGDYARYRPKYPPELYQFISGICREHELAWDCATGNGQAAIGLANYFDQVIASDASSQQVQSAEDHESVSFVVAPAEQSGLPDNSVDVVTVAQALHWFDIGAFFREAARVLKPDGVLCIWAYEHCRADASIDPIINDIFEAVEEYWPPEREIVESRYRDVQFPWPLLDAPEFAMTASWSVDDILGYFGTWSATRRFQATTGANPIDPFSADLRCAWGENRRLVSWPLTVRASARNGPA